MTRSQDPDRRSHPRAPLHRPAVVFVGDKRLSAQAVDVSESGIGVALPGEGAAGTFVRVNFAMEDTNAGAATPWLDVDGVVVRTHAHAGKFVWGIRFLSAPPAVVAGIKSHVAGTTTPRRAVAPRLPPPPVISDAPARATAPKAAAPKATPPRVAPPAPLPKAVAAPRVASRQASDLRELYRSALDQVRAERARAKKR